MIQHQPIRSSRLGAIVLAFLLLVVVTLSGSPRAAHAATLPCTVQWGMYDTNTPWDPNETAIKNLDAAVNRHSSIVHWFAQWGDNGSGNFSANQPWMLSNVRSYTSVGVTGSTPFITWEPWGPAPYTAANNTFPLQGIAAGNFDTYIDSWANGLHTYGGPVLLDFGHEMDGNWYPWGYGVNGNTATDFIAAYRHVHDRFVLAGATNVQFVWTVDIWNPAGINPTTFYPGDAYVDRLAIDVFNWGAAGGGWASLSQGLDATQVYTRLASLSTKPIMLGEWASAEATPGDPAGASKSQWILDAAQALASTYTRITTVIWFSWAGSPFALDSSSASLAAANTAFGGC
jgi:glycosyl hydrolase family 26